VSNGDLVVVYDRLGIHMAASRAWWMFRLFGHDNVRVLNGGLPAWIAAGYDTQDKNTSPKQGTFTAKFRPELFKHQDDILKNIEGKSFQTLDARDSARFAGAAPEPRPGMAPGHIPGSVNTPFAALVDPVTGMMKPKDAIAAVLSRVDLSRPIACSCGSGVTACVVALGLHELGVGNAAVYDGSWAEWGGNAALPKATGS
jgi:thiosulfate/3-mercaptopyruvate sulfurtransferase